jgi:hypothetical protein
MVIGALLFGVLAGILVPSPKPAVHGSTANRLAEAKQDAKPKRDLAAFAKEKDSALEPAAADAKVKQDADCNRQTWPYYSPSCIDRDAPAPQAVRTVRTRPADPSVAIKSDGKEQAAAPEPKATREVRQPKNATVPATAVAPAQAQTEESDPVQTRSASPTQAAPPAQTQTRAPRGQALTAPRGARNQPRYTRIDPPEDIEEDEAPRVLLRSDGTRVYVFPEPGSVRPEGDRRRRSW